MKFKFAPKGIYQRNQLITIAGVEYMVVEVGRSLIAKTTTGPVRHITVILTDAKPIVEIPVPHGYTADELDRDNPYTQGD
jgi:hypothetical protein